LRRRSTRSSLIAHDAARPSLAPLTGYLRAVGIPGLIAYFGLLDVGCASAGDTVVVSGAAGDVGSAAGQIARITGCRVIGIAGGPEKCRWLLDELGFDAAINYKAADVARALEELAPDGVDVFFDNVGGEILDAVLTHLARGARVVISGGLSQYNADQRSGPSNYLELLRTRSSMTGFITPDFADRYPQTVVELAGWLREGRLISREQVIEGRRRCVPGCAAEAVRRREPRQADPRCGTRRRGEQ
jgi:NADPH-dependent curcumin reductase